mgnify:CR=1 FL=1
MTDIALNYDEVDSVISELITVLEDDAEDIDFIYRRLLMNFSESSGEEADALRALLASEEKLMKVMKQTLTKFGENIRFAAGELSRVDTTFATAMIGIQATGSKIGK